MAVVSLEATIQAEARTESRLGRAMGFSAGIKSEKPSLYITGGPKPLKIDESRFTIEKPEG